MENVHYKNGVIRPATKLIIKLCANEFAEYFPTCKSGPPSKESNLYKLLAERVKDVEVIKPDLIAQRVRSHYEVIHKQVLATRKKNRKLIIII